MLLLRLRSRNDEPRVSKEFRRFLYVSGNFEEDSVVQTNRETKVPFPG